MQLVCKIYIYKIFLEGFEVRNPIPRPPLCQGGAKGANDIGMREIIDSGLDHSLYVAIQRARMRGLLPLSCQDCGRGHVPFL